MVVLDAVVQDIVCNLDGITYTFVQICCFLVHGLKPPDWSGEFKLFAHPNVHCH